MDKHEVEILLARSKRVLARSAEVLRETEGFKCKIQASNSVERLKDSIRKLNKILHV